MVYYTCTTSTMQQVESYYWRLYISYANWNNTSHRVGGHSILVGARINYIRLWSRHNFMTQSFVQPLQLQSYGVRFRCFQSMSSGSNTSASSPLRSRPGLRGPTNFGCTRWHSVCCATFMNWFASFNNLKNESLRSQSCSTRVLILDSPHHWPGSKKIQNWAVIWSRTLVTFVFHTHTTRISYSTHVSSDSSAWHLRLWVSCKFMTKSICFPQADQSRLQPTNLHRLIAQIHEIKRWERYRN